MLGYLRKLGVRMPFMKGEHVLAEELEIGSLGFACLLGDSVLLMNFK